MSLGHQCPGRNQGARSDQFSLCDFRIFSTKKTTRYPSFTLKGLTSPIRHGIRGWTVWALRIRFRSRFVKEKKNILPSIDASNQMYFSFQYSTGYQPTSWLSLHRVVPPPFLSKVISSHGLSLTMRISSVFYVDYHWSFVSRAMVYHWPCVFRVFFMWIIIGHSYLGPWFIVGHSDLECFSYGLSLVIRILNVFCVGYHWPFSFGKSINVLDSQCLWQALTVALTPRRITRRKLIKSPSNSAPTIGISVSDFPLHGKKRKKYVFPLWNFILACFFYFRRFFLECFCSGKFQSHWRAVRKKWASWRRAKRRSSICRRLCRKPDSSMRTICTVSSDSKTPRAMRSL